MSRLSVTLAGVAAAIGMLPPDKAASKDYTAVRPALQCVILSGPHIKRVGVDVIVDGVHAFERQQRLFEALHRYHDVDGNGNLSAAEIEHLPTSYGMRGWASGQIVTSTAPLPKAADRDGNEAVSVDELAAFYNATYPPVITVYGVSPTTAGLNRSLGQVLNNLDAGSRDLAMALLSKYDRNADRLISPGELVAGARYPGTSASTVVLPRTRSPIVLVPMFGNVGPWREALFKRLDANSDQALDASEFSPTDSPFNLVDANRNQHVDRSEWTRWLASPPSAAVRIDVQANHARFQLDSDRNRSSDATSLPIEASGRIRVRFHGGRSSEDRGQSRITTIADQLLELAGSGTAVTDDQIESARNQAELRRVRVLIDVNRNGQMELKEIEAWRDFMRTSVRSQVVVSVMDFEDSLFARIDRNHDGSISAVEAETLSELLHEHHLPADAARAGARQLRVCVSIGRPETLLDTSSTSLANIPDWFAPMDRNRDGSVGTDEFLGEAFHFRRLDRNGDGMLDPNEL